MTVSFISVHRVKTELNHRYLVMVFHIYSLSYIPYVIIGVRWIKNSVNRL